MANWIADATKNKGGLHRSLKVPMGKKIPQSKINNKLVSLGKVENKTAKQKRVVRQLNLAKTLSKFHK